MSQEDQALQVGKLVLRRNELAQQAGALRAKVTEFSKAYIRLSSAISNATPGGEDLESALSGIPEKSIVRQTVAELLQTQEELESTKKQLSPFGV